MKIHKRENSQANDNSNTNLRSEYATKNNNYNHQNPPELVDASGSKLGEKYEDINIQSIRKNIPRRNHGSSRCNRISRNAPQYVGLYFSVDGEYDLLDTATVFNFIQ